MQELLNYPMQVSMEIEILKSYEPYTLEISALDHG